MSFSNRARRILAIGPLFACVNVYATSDAAVRSPDVTVSEATNFAVTVSHDDGSLIIDAQGTLWRIPAGGGAGRAVSDAVDDARQPDWSLDGRRLFFQWFRAGNWDIASSTPDGGEREALLDWVSDEREPAVSPDGSRVAFASDRSGNFDVLVFDIARRAVEQITSDAGDDYMPAWSPDGLSLVYVSKRTAWGTPELRRVDLTTGRQEQIVTLTDEPSYPAWSPDGQQIIVRLMRTRQLVPLDLHFSLDTTSSWTRKVPVETDVAAITLATGTVERLTHGADVFPGRPVFDAGGGLYFGADGKIRYLAAPLGATAAADVPFELKFPLARAPYDRQPRALPVPGRHYAVRGIVRPSISPDGSAVAFAALDGVWVAPLTEGGADAAPRRCTPALYHATDPAWSPDGSRIVFSADAEGSMDLWTINAHTCTAQSLRRLTKSPGAEMVPSWSPDGSRISYLDQRRRLVVIDAANGDEQFAFDKLYSPGLPSWSSDSRRLAIADLERPSKRYFDGRNRVLIIEIGTGDARFLALPDRSFGVRAGDGPSWSPDGRSLALSMGGGVWVLPITSDGQVAGTLRKVASEPGDFLSWNASSGEVTYLAADGLRSVDPRTLSVRKHPLQLHFRATPVTRSTLLIRDVRLIDGTGGPVREHVDIVVVGDRIARVARTGVRVPRSAKVIEGAGRTVIPGLIDAHTHWPSLPIGIHGERTWLAYGITTVRVTGGPMQRLLEAREATTAGLRRGPRIYFAGFMFDGDQVDYPDSLSIHDEHQLEAELARAAALDADLVKSYVRLGSALQKSLVERAHKRGLFVTSHELYPAVTFGIDGIEHIGGRSKVGYSSALSELGNMYDDAVQLISRSGVYVVPTLQAFGGLDLTLQKYPELVHEARFGAANPPWVTTPYRAFASQASDGQRRGWEQLMRPRFEAVQALAAHGARLLAGADANDERSYGLSMLAEIEQMSHAGMGPLAAIHTATGLAAEAIGVDRELGTIAPGKIADLVIVHGNPAAEIHDIFRTEHVIFNGHLIHATGTDDAE